MARANLLVFLGDKPTIWEPIVSHSKSGMSHKLPFTVSHQGRIERISTEVAAVLGFETRKWLYPQERGKGYDLPLFTI